VRELRRAMETGRCHLRENMSRSLLARVRQGLLDSPFTVDAVRDFCKTKF